MSAAGINRPSEIEGLTPAFARQHKNNGHELASRLEGEREELEIFSAPVIEQARSARFFATPPESTLSQPERKLTAGVLNRAVEDLLRFRGASGGVELELYRDAYRWIEDDDIYSPLSFLNVCQSLGLRPQVIRTKLLTASFVHENPPQLC